MRGDDWEVVARNVVQLLRPGGAVQWEDMKGGESWLFASDGTEVPQTSDSMAMSRLTGMVKGVAGDRLQHGGPTTLGPIFSGLGLKDVGLETVSSDTVAAVRKPMSVNFMQLGMLAARRFLKAGLLEGRTTEELDELERKVLEEIDAGAYYTALMYITIGWQP